MVLNLISFFGIGIMLLLVQAHPWLPFAQAGIRPDFLLVFVIFLGTEQSLCRGAFICFVLGYGVECLSGVNCGLYQLIYMTVFVTIKLLKKFFNFDTAINIFLLGVLCVSIKALMLLFSFNYIYEYVFADFNKIFLLETLFTLLLFPFLFCILKKVFINNKETLIPRHNLKHGYRVR